MNIKEAYAILGMPETATDDELKKQHKLYVKKFHPDIYKEDPDKLKKINEAYQLIQDYRSNPNKYEPQGFSNGPFANVNIQDIFSHFHNNFIDNEDAPQQREINIPPPHVTFKISFKESILGVEKQINYKRYVKCATCDGVGLEYVGNGCLSCNGFGRVVSNSKGMVFSKVCTKCYGKNIKKSKCKICDLKGVVEADISGSVHVPAGILDGSTLRLQGSGHYAGKSFFGDGYGDVFVHVNVDKDPDLQLVGQDVVSYLKLSLLDAITGCQRDVKTIHGTKAISVPEKSKNKEEIRISGCGVKNTTGVQRVILDVEYPGDVSALVGYLKNIQN